MNNLNSMYSELNSLVNYNSNINEFKNNLLSAYKSLDNLDLSKCFLVDGVAADKGKIAKLKENILSLYNDVNKEIRNVENAITDQRQIIKDEEYRIEYEQKLKEQQNQLQD